jgi:hypothetical protein
MTFSLSSKEIKYKKIITLSLYPILKKLVVPLIYKRQTKILLPANMYQ